MKLIIASRRLANRRRKLFHRDSDPTGLLLRRILQIESVRNNEPAHAGLPESEVLVRAGPHGVARKIKMKKIRSQGDSDL
jgi:hypothetical protein